MTHPEPIVKGRPAKAMELPRMAKSLLSHGARNGWAQSATYAHGTSIDRRGDPTKEVESIVLRLGRGSLGAVCVWHDGAFETAWVWSKFTNPATIGFRQLVKFVNAPASDPR